MNRSDILNFERFYGSQLRAEAKRRAKRYPQIAEQLDRWADASDARAEAVRAGPLFDTEKAA